MTTQLTNMVMAMVIGMVFGTIYFGGLWFTVQRLPEMRRQAMWMIASTVLRLSILMAGLYLAFGNQWKELLFALLGIIIVRSIMLRKISANLKSGLTTL